MSAIDPKDPTYWPKESEEKWSLGKALQDKHYPNGRSEKDGEAYPIARPVREHFGTILDAEDRLIGRAPSEYAEQLVAAFNTQKRPYSDKLAQEVIEGQVKEIDRLTKLVQSLRSARAAIIEECAKVCDDLKKLHESDAVTRGGMVECAAAIRALASTAKKGDR